MMWRQNLLHLKLSHTPLFVWVEGSPPIIKTLLKMAIFTHSIISNMNKLPRSQLHVDYYKPNFIPFLGTDKNNV